MSLVASVAALIERISGTLASVTGGPSAPSEEALFASTPLAAFGRRCIACLLL